MHAMVVSTTDANEEKDYINVLTRYTVFSTASLTDAKVK